MDPTEAMTQQAMEQGRRNAEAIVLIKKHCAHARVEASPHHGHSMVEDWTGLPISGREMRCQFGKAPTMVGWDLLENAARFYSENCVGCPHREVQAIPNLKTVVEQHREAQRHEQERLGRAREREASELCARGRRRAQAAEGEPPSTRALIALLDGIDSQQPDERRTEFVDLCRAAPEACTERAAAILLETAAHIQDEQFFEGLRHLNRTGVLSGDQFLRAAIDALSVRPLKEAAGLVVDLGDGLQAGQLGPAMRSIVALSAPLVDFHLDRRRVDLEPLHLAAKNELPALLDTIIEFLGSESKHYRRAGASAAAALIDHEASVTQVLLRPLIDALYMPGSLDHYMGDPLDALIDAFDAALNADPVFVIATIEKAGLHAPGPIRSTLFRVFSYSIRGNRRTQVAANGAIDAAFRRMGGDWGEEIVHDAADFLEDAARFAPELVSGRVDELFGLLLSYVSAPTKRASILDVSPDTPPEFRALEASQQGFMRTATIRKLREALGHLAQSAPGAVARNVFSVIGATEIDTPEAEELRDEAVRLLGDLGKRPDLLPDVLPALWTALLHRNQSVRAQAIEAWREIASVAHRELPSDLGELLPRLLSDQYVIVHKGVVRALARGLPVPESQRPEVVRILLVLANYYKTDDADLLEDILVVLWSQARHYTEPATRALRETCLGYAKHLTVYDKARFLEWRRESAEGLPSYTERLVETLADPNRNRVGGHRDDRLFKLLRDLPADQIEAVAGLLPTAALQHLPDDTWEAQRFIEVLQRCGHWAGAAELAAKLVDVLPDDAEHAIQRDGLVRQRAICVALCSLIDGAADVVAHSLLEANEANRRQITALAEYRYPWESEE